MTVPCHFHIPYIASVPSSFFKPPQFGPSALVSTPPMPPTKHTKTQSKYVRWFGDFFEPSLTKAYTGPRFTFLVNFFLSGVCIKWWQASSHRLGVYVGDSPWSDTNSPTYRKSSSFTADHYMTYLTVTNLVDYDPCSECWRIDSSSKFQR